MFIFKPGNIDPVTMPHYNYFIIPQGWCIFNHLANGCGCRPEAGSLSCAPVCILMSGGSAPGRCKAGPLQVGLWPGACFTRTQGWVWLKPNRLPFICCFTSVNTNQERRISYLNTISLRLLAKDSSLFAIEADDKWAFMLLTLTRWLSM